MTLYIDGAQVRQRHVPQTHPLYFSFDEGLDLGMDTGMPAYEGYRAWQRRVLRNDQMG